MATSITRCAQMYAGATPCRQMFRGNHSSNAIVQLLLPRCTGQGEQAATQACARLLAVKHHAVTHHDARRVLFPYCATRNDRCLGTAIEQIARLRLWRLPSLVGLRVPLRVPVYYTKSLPPPQQILQCGIFIAIACLQRCNSRVSWKPHLCQLGDLWAGSVVLRCITADDATHPCFVWLQLRAHRKVFCAQQQGC